jgi:hypothetical protein
MADIQKFWFNKLKAQVKLGILAYKLNKVNNS